MSKPPTHRVLSRTLAALATLAVSAPTQFTSCTRQTVGSGRTVFDLAATDLDGDGNVDLLEVQRYSGAIWVYRNVNGSFAVPTMLPAPRPSVQQYYSVRVADLDADGRPDVIAADFLTRSIVVWRGATQGRFTAPPDVYPIPGVNGTGDGCYYVDVGDVDGDGYLDFVTANYRNGSQGGVFVGRNAGAMAPGTFTIDSYQFSNNSWSITGVAMGDWDGDGDLDIAFTGWWNPPPRGNPICTRCPWIQTMSNNGAGAFSAPTQHGSYTGYIKGMELVVADFNGDGRDDICMADAAFDPSNQVPVAVRLLLSGASGWSEQTVANLRCGPNRVIATDFDGDGDVDIAVANYGTTTSIPDRGLHLLTNPLIGGGGWSSTHYYNDGVAGLAFADVDGDGRHDLVFRNNNQIRLDRNCGTAPFSAEFGIASHGSRGFSHQWAQTRPALGTTLHLRATALPPSAAGLSILGSTQRPPVDLSTVLARPWPPEGTPLLFVTPIFTSVSNVDARGVLDWTLAIPSSPSLQGVTVATQSLVIDLAANRSGVTATRPLHHHLW